MGGRKQALTAKAKRFVHEYLIDLNGTKAAKRAGYAGDSAALARAASELLKKPEIAAALEVELEAQKARTLLTADQVLLDIQRIGNLAEKAEDYSNALRSRELIGKRYKLFTDKIEMVNTTPRAERLREARLRRQQGEKA